MRRLTVLAASIAVVLVGVSAASPVSTTQAATQGRWAITDLGTLSGDKVSEAVAINERGQIIGDSNSKGAAAGNVAHPFIWENGTMRALRTLGGDYNVVAALNEQGWMVGNAENKQGDDRAVLWQNGKLRDLGTFGGDNSWANAINERGQVVGTATTKSDEQHPFLWQNGKLRDLGTFGGDNSWANAINERAQVVGDSQYPGYKTRAFLWQNGKLRDLGTLGGKESGSSAPAWVEFLSSRTPRVPSTTAARSWAGRTPRRPPTRSSGRTGRWRPRRLGRQGERGLSHQRARAGGRRRGHLERRRHYARGDGARLPLGEGEDARPRHAGRGVEHGLRRQ